MVPAAKDWLQKLWAKMPLLRVRHGGSTHGLGLPTTVQRGASIPDHCQDGMAVVPNEGLVLSPRNNRSQVLLKWAIQGTQGYAPILP